MSILIIIVVGLGSAVVISAVVLRLLSAHKPSSGMAEYYKQRLHELRDEIARGEYDK